MSDVDQTVFVRLDGVALTALRRLIEEQTGREYQLSALVVSGIGPVMWFEERKADDR